MAHEPDNPYRSPQTECEPIEQPPPPAAPQRFDCPQCGFRFPFWRVYWRLRGSLLCPKCGTPLKVSSFGPGPWLVRLIVLPSAVFSGWIGAAALINYFEPGFMLPSRFQAVSLSRLLFSLFLVTIAWSCAAAYHIDRRFTYLQVKGPPSSTSGERREAENVER